MVDRWAEGGRVQEEVYWGPRVPDREVPGGAAEEVGAGVGARLHYQGQEVVQQPRSVLLQVKGWTVGQRHYGSCDRRVGVSAAGAGPIGKLNQDGQAVPASRGWAGTLTAEVAALPFGPEGIVAGGRGTVAAQGLE